MKQSIAWSAHDGCSRLKARIAYLELSSVSNIHVHNSVCLIESIDTHGASRLPSRPSSSPKGRATVDRLQAEASRIFADAGSTAAPIADKLTAGVSTLPEVGRSAGQSAGSRLSQLSGSVAAKLSGSARNAAVQIGSVKDGVKDATGGLGATVAGGLSEAVGRGAGKVLPSVGEAGRKVTDGVSTLSKSAADGLPVVRDRAAAFSSQIGSAAGGAGKALNEGVSKLSKTAADGLPAVQDQVSVLTSQVSPKLFCSVWLGRFGLWVEGSTSSVSVC